MVSRLHGMISGDVIGPDHAAYDARRALFYSGFDARPAVIVRPADATDVARAVTFARDNGLELAVRSGGHSAAGHSTCDGGLVLDLSSMNALDIDPANRTAWAETGLTAGAYTRAVGAHGLATGFGDAPSVGIGGITLGGGVGFLHRRHGLTIDNLLAAEIVTAEGELVHTDADSHPDLFWAIRGGGGNFGVATRFQYRLCDVNNVTAGMMMLPATPSTVASFIAEAEAAPDEMAGMINIMIAPPMPMIPAEAHGQPIIMALLLHAGTAGAGERAFAPFRAIATPIADFVKPMRYASIYDGPEPPKPIAIAVQAFFRDSFDRSDAERVLDGLRESTAPMRVAQVRVLGGAVSRVAADATAFAHRDRRMLAVVAAAFDSRHDAPQHDAWAGRMAADLQQGEPGGYVGFLADVDAATVREAYRGPTWDRLRAVKAHYDPDNLFHRNQNIPAAAAAFSSSPADHSRHSP